MRPFARLARLPRLCALLLSLSALLPPGHAAAGPAPGRVWIAAHTDRRDCTARLGVSTGRQQTVVKIRGPRTHRYLTTLVLRRGGAIATDRLRASCRVKVKRTGTVATRDPRARSMEVTSSTGLDPGSTSLLSAPEIPGSSGSRPVLGTFNIVGPEQMQAWAAAGGNAVVVPVIWADAQPVAGGSVDLSAAGNGGQNVPDEIADAREAGLQVYLELDLQYPPDWVKESVPRYVDQAGSAFAATTPGMDIRDWVWSQVGREAVANFAAGALSALGPDLGTVAGIRVGGGMFGEMQYPYDGSEVGGQPSYWGYDEAAQIGTGLATGQEATPLPGYVYGQGSAVEDAEWASWYLDSLGNFVHWYILQLRADGWEGPVYVLHPSYGIRDNWSTGSKVYRQELARGTDFAVQMDSYDTIPNVWPWSTWADDAEPYYSAGDAVDSDQAAWRKLLVLARERGLASHILGENTGGGGEAAIDRLMHGALAAGYRGIFYLDYPSLTEGGGSLLTSLVSSFDAQLSPTAAAH